MEVKLGYLIAYVEHVESELQFFEAVFSLERKLLTPEKDYGELQTGETTLAFGDYALYASNFGQQQLHAMRKSTAAQQEIALVTDEVEAIFGKALHHGAKSVSEPTRKP